MRSINWIFAGLSLCFLLLSGCVFSQPAVGDILHTSTPSELTEDSPTLPGPTKILLVPSPTSTITPTAGDWSLSHHPSKAKFQVFILNPVRTCLAGNDFASGNVCYGNHCGDCDCRWEDFDPPAPMVGISPEHIGDPQFSGYAFRQCVTISLTEAEIEQIKANMQKISELVFEWSEGALELDMVFTELPHDHTGFVAPDFVFGPFEVDDELLNPYVDIMTDLIYVVTGVYDHEQDLHLAYACGGSYGEMSIHGAGYANIQYNDACNSVVIDRELMYEPLIHEWFHNLDWALYNINHVPDKFEGLGPDWENWEHGSWPACNTGGDPITWFPSVDFCEWDPDWIDCNNQKSAGRCVHASEKHGAIS